MTTGLYSWCRGCREPVLTGLRQRFTWCDACATPETDVVAQSCPDASEARDLRSTGMTFQQIAAQLDCSVSWVYRQARGVQYPCRDCPEPIHKGNRCHGCQREYARECERARRVPNVYTRTACAQCSEPLEQSHYGRPRKYCPRPKTCRDKACAPPPRPRRHRRILRECKACGEWMSPPSGQRKYCSQDCNESYRPIVEWLSGKAGSPLWMRRCEGCGIRITPTSPHASSIKWCPDCLRTQTIDKWRRERNERRGARAEPYRNIDIFERDGWTCQLCGEGVDPTLTFPNVMSASIDHVVPICEGGLDAPWNVQLAHFSCNSRKHRGSRVGAQLRLFEA